MMDDIERQLLEAGRPEPRGEARARVLAATMPLVRREGSRLDRIWFSRRWRTAAGLMLLILPGVDAVSTRIVALAPMTEVRRPADAAQAVEMAALEMGLTPADAAALRAQAIAATRPPTMTTLRVETLYRGSNR